MEAEYRAALSWVSGSQRLAAADTFDPVGFVRPHPGAARLTIDPERAISHMPGRFFPAEFKPLHSLPPNVLVMPKVAELSDERRNVMTL